MATMSKMAAIPYLKIVLWFKVHFISTVSKDKKNNIKQQSQEIIITMKNNRFTT
jgi:hypothetical protein